MGVAEIRQIIVSVLTFGPGTAETIEIDTMDRLHRALRDMYYTIMTRTHVYCTLLLRVGWTLQLSSTSDSGLLIHDDLVPYRAAGRNAAYRVH
jgi:hypothetical protein